MTDSKNWKNINEPEDKFLQTLAVKGVDYTRAALDYQSAKEARLRFYNNTQQTIKAAVQAIEDIMPSSHDQCPENSVCHLCDILTLEPNLKALKGLIDV